MSEKNELKPRGIVRPKGGAWLKQVKADAAQNAINHVTRQLEKKEQAAERARGVTVEEMTAAAKKRLSGMSTFEPRARREDLEGDDADFEDEDLEDELDDESFDEDASDSSDEKDTVSSDDGDDSEEVKPMAKPFANLNKDELLDVAAKEGVEVPEGATNPQIRELIKAKRGEAK